MAGPKLTTSIWYKLHGWGARGQIWSNRWLQLRTAVLQSPHCSPLLHIEPMCQSDGPPAPPGGLQGGVPLGEVLDRAQEGWEFERLGAAMAMGVG